jgi:tetratricopeptide (TPR) repeat protein
MPGQDRGNELIQQYMDSVSDWDYESAQEAIDELEKMNMELGYPIGFYRVFLLLRLGRYDEALEMVNTFEPTLYNTDYLQLRAEIYRDMHRLDDARTDLENIRLVAPAEIPYVLFLLRNIEIMSGNPDKAGEMEKLLGDRYPLDRYTRFCTLYKALQERDFRVAEEILNRMSSTRILDETGEDLTAFYAPYVLFGRAEMAFDQGDVDRAVDILTAMPDSYPLITTVWTQLSYAGLAYGRFDDARAWSIEGIVRCGGLDKLRELRIDVPESAADYEPQPELLRCDDAAYLFGVLGNVYLMEGDFDMAIACAGTAKGINPYETGAYTTESLALELKDDYIGAIGAAVAGLTKNPYDDTLARIYARQAESAPQAVPPDAPSPESLLDARLEANRRLYEAYPQNPDCACSLASILESLDMDGACELYRESYEELPQRIEIAMSYAGCLASSGDVDSALAVADNFSLHLDLPWLADMYRNAESSGNEGILAFADRIRERVDPDGEFDSLLDPLAENARSAVESAAAIENVESE